MKLYTRTGDEGQTGVIGGRVDKDDIRVEAYGTIDEVNAFVGEAVARLDPEVHADLIADLMEIQHELFDAGGDLAQAGKKRNYKVTGEMVTRLEEWIDRYDKEAPEIRRLFCPGEARHQRCCTSAGYLPGERNGVWLLSPGNRRPMKRFAAI